HLRRVANRRPLVQPRHRRRPVPDLRRPGGVAHPRRKLGTWSELVSEPQHPRRGQPRSFRLQRRPGQRHRPSRKHSFHPHTAGLVSERSLPRGLSGRLLPGASKHIRPIAPRTRCCPTPPPSDAGRRPQGTGSNRIQSKFISPAWPGLVNTTNTSPRPAVLSGVVSSIHFSQPPVG